MFVLLNLAAYQTFLSFAPRRVPVHQHWCQAAATATVPGGEAVPGEFCVAGGKGSGL